MAKSVGKNRMDASACSSYVAPMRRGTLMGGPSWLCGKTVMLAAKKLRWEWQGHVYVLAQDGNLYYRGQELTNGKGTP